jgi:hypothetical protein
VLSVIEDPARDTRVRMPQMSCVWGGERESERARVFECVLCVRVVCAFRARHECMQQT